MRNSLRSRFSPRILPIRCQLFLPFVLPPPPKASASLDGAEREVGSLSKDEGIRPECSWFDKPVLSELSPFDKLRMTGVEGLTTNGMAGKIETDKVAVWLLIAVFALASCGPKREVLPPGSAGADQFLYEHGMAALKAKKWTDATDYFTKLIDGYPQSQYRAEAKLGVGDVYLAQGTAESLVLAQNEYREFLTFYPTSPRADYAQYQLGMTHYKAMRSPGRDQTATKQAVNEFEFLLQRYPNSSMASEAKARLRESKDRLDESDFGVGMHYYRTRWYPGAIARFKALLKSDPEFTNRDAVYFYLAESLLKSENKADRAEALAYYGRLVAEFENSEYLADARKRISELNGPDNKRS